MEKTGKQLIVEMRKLIINCLKKNPESTTVDIEQLTGLRVEMKRYRYRIAWIVIQSLIDDGIVVDNGEKGRGRKFSIKETY